MSKTTEYQDFLYHCLKCGRFAWSAKVPAGVDPKYAAPVSCGAKGCGSSRFLATEKGAAA